MIIIDIVWFEIFILKDNATLTMKNTENIDKTNRF
jgi:hypothetical protein